MLTLHTEWLIKVVCIERPIFGFTVKMQAITLSHFRVRLLLMILINVIPGMAALLRKS